MKSLTVSPRWSLWAWMRRRITVAVKVLVTLPILVGVCGVIGRRFEPVRAWPGVKMNRPWPCFQTPTIMPG